jgi:Ring finger domain
MPYFLSTTWIIVITLLTTVLIVVLAFWYSKRRDNQRQRGRLERRVTAGEVDLEALGIARIRVAQEYLDKMPKYIYGRRDGDSTCNDVQGQPQAGDVFYAQAACPVCLDEFIHNETPVRELPCKHVFHVDCVDPFLRQSSSLCPVCRSSALPAGTSAVGIMNDVARRERLPRDGRHSQPAVTQGHEQRYMQAPLEAPTTHN